MKLSRIRINFNFNNTLTIKNKKTAPGILPDAVFLFYQLLIYVLAIKPYLSPLFDISSPIVLIVSACNHDDIHQPANSK